MPIQIVGNQIKDSAVSNSKIANSTIQPAKIDLSQVFAFGAIPTLSADPTADNQVVRKSYVDSKINGLSWKAACRVKTTGNIDLSSAPAAIDGVTLASDDRVLVASQSSSAENGIYVFAGSGSAMTRAADADSFAELQDGAAVFIKEGNTFESNAYQQSATLTNFGGQNWILFSATGGGRQADGTKGMDLTGNTFSVKIDNSSVGFNGSGQLEIKAAGITDVMVSSGTLSNAKLQNSSITLTAGAGLTGGGSAALGGSSTLAVQSDASNTIAVSGSGIGVADASLQASKLASNSVTTNKVADANITLDKLQAMDQARIMVGNSSNRPAFVQVSGDATLADSGALTLNSNAVATATIQDSAVTNSKLASSAVTLVAGDGIANLGSLALGASMNVNLNLDGSSLSKGASGLKVASGGITGTELAANSVTSAAVADDAIGSTELAANAVLTVKIADDAVTLAKCGFSFTQEVFTGTSSTTYDLSNAVIAGFDDAIFVFRNGLLCQKVGSPSDESEYSVSLTGGVGGVCRITFGAAPNGDKVIVKYMV
tara:strand:+ start:5723 stop:7354 length:1632 start_codon:yes stop_codon:yes gene_type:complete